MEYPAGRLAVLTEGQAVPGKKRRQKPVTNRQKLDSYADLSPGDLVVHEHHGVGRFPGDAIRISIKDYVNDRLRRLRRALRPRHPAWTW